MAEILIDTMEELYTGTHAADTLDMLTCILCMGLTYKPKKCKQCETLLCRACIQA